MKKIVLSLLLVAATMNVMATVTAKAKLTLTAGAAQSTMTVYETDEDVADYNFPMLMTGHSIALYAKSGDVKYESFAMAELKELELGLMTNTETSYTITASEVVGSISIKLLDGSIFVASEGASKTFTAQASQTEITGMMVNPIEPAFCHQYGHLIINGHQGESLVVKDLAGNEKINIASLPTNEEVVELDALTAGEQYKVSLNGAEPVIIRK